MVLFVEYFEIVVDIANARNARTAGSQIHKDTVVVTLQHALQIFTSAQGRTLI